MKIRIQGNSLRLRLTQSEVQQLAGLGKVEAVIRFGASPAQQLVYSLELNSEAEMSAAYADGHIRVFVPRAAALAWANSEQVGLEHEQPLDDNSSLRILVEKDFQCLTDRAHEDESDHFPNPSSHC